LIDLILKINQKVVLYLSSGEQTLLMWDITDSYWQKAIEVV